jgi:hypothetical protein
MARFYARFDQGTDATLEGTGLTDYFFTKRTISGTSASAALLRDGLIASRSALSADVYEDLPASYENGGLGTIIPSAVITTDSSTYVSWSNAYTASVSNPPAPGIIIPADYRTRPTSSIIVDSRIGGPTGSGGVSYSVYTAATNAVAAVLNAFSNGQSPLTAINQGNNSSRTLHSIWHDPSLQYFAYDNFTPGTPQALTANVVATATSVSSSTVTVYFSASYEYLNDINMNGSASISATLRDVAGDPFSPAENLSVVVPISSLTTVNSTTRAYVWNAGTIIENSTLNNGGNLTYVSWSFIDAVITNSYGPYSSTSRNTGATSNAGACWFKIGSD